MHVSFLFLSEVLVDAIYALEGQNGVRACAYGIVNIRTLKGIRLSPLQVGETQRVVVRDCRSLQDMVVGGVR